MKDYFVLLTKPRNFQKPQETKPSLPSKAPFDGNDGSSDKGFQNFKPSKPYKKPDGTLVIPFNSEPRYHWWKPGGQSITQTLREIDSTDDAIRPLPLEGTL